MELKELKELKKLKKLKELKGLKGLKKLKELKEFLDKPSGKAEQKTVVFSLLVLGRSAEVEQQWSSRTIVFDSLKIYTDESKIFMGNDYPQRRAKDAESVLSQ